MAAKVAIIGKGSVGSALQRGLQRVGCEVRITGKDPGAVREAAGWGELVFLAVPFGAIDETLKELGDAVKGKVLVDVTNALTPDYQLALGCTTSGAEELQKKAAGAKVVKAFNTVFAVHMDKGKLKGETLTLFVAGDDAGAKERVLKLGRDIGFDALDVGPLRNARWLETLGFFNIQLAFTQKLGSETGFRYVR
jgi:8-hydroxy-5-deazaflavin:NADPH oxidoreductase